MPSEIGKQKLFELVKVITVDKGLLEDTEKFKQFVQKCVELNSNLVVFGLPNSGKSTLVKAICKKSTKYWTLEEDEVQCEKNGLAIKKDLPGKKWVVSHQLPTMDESVTAAFLSKFLAEKMGLNPKKWAIVRIKTK